MRVGWCSNGNGMAEHIGGSGGLLVDWVDGNRVGLASIHMCKRANIGPAICRRSWSSVVASVRAVGRHSETGSEVHKIKSVNDQW